MSEALPLGYQLMKSMGWIITAVRSGCRPDHRRHIERPICTVSGGHFREARKEANRAARCASSSQRALYLAAVASIA